MAKYRRYTKELLAPIVAESSSVADVLRRLGLSQNGGAHAHLSKTIRAFEIDTSHFRPYSGGGRRRRLQPHQILTRRPYGARREKPHMLKRALVEIGLPYACTKCGNRGIWMGEPLTLEIDHIDGDFHNNEAANLRFLCPNCHRQTPNFAGRSKGRYAHHPLTPPQSVDT